MNIDVDPRGLPRVRSAPWILGLMTPFAYFSLSKYTKQHLLVSFCDTLSGIEVIFWIHGNIDFGQGIMDNMVQGIL